MISRLMPQHHGERFLKALIFFDAKRPITQGILQRINLEEVAKHYHVEEKIKRYLSL
jgi:hypothetical protein